MFCLPKYLVDQFLSRIKSGEIDPVKMSEMSSKERHDYFSSFLGEKNAAQVNAKFESKLLLKNQQQGILNWAKQLGGMKPEAQRDILSRVDRMTEVLQPKDVDGFLSDLASQKIGVSVTQAEAGKIADMAKDVQIKKEAMESGGDRLDYGRAYVDFHDYVSQLKLEAQKMTPSDVIRHPVKTVSKIAGISKSIVATLDNSAIGRQGIKTLWAHPSIWANNALKSFRDIVRTLGGKEVMRELNADIVSRPNYRMMKRAKLDVGVTEEAFPETIQEKIPVIGRVFKASDVAYSSFLQKTRADVFDKYIDIAKKSGVDVTDKAELESIGKLVNSITGRGHLGRAEPAAQIANNVFFSPRKLKSDIDFLTAHAGDSSVSAFAKKQAALNLLKMVSGTAAILAIANSVKPGSVELDPRSSDFGKIRIGNTRFDATGGIASIVTLGTRLLTLSSKSASSGIVSKLNSGEFGSQTGMDVIYNFAENKLSPVSSVLRDLMRGRTFEGGKPTAESSVNNLFRPMILSTYEELQKDPDSADKLLSLIADGLGISVNTYPNVSQKVKSEPKTKNQVMRNQYLEAAKKYSDAIRATKDPEKKAEYEIKRKEYVEKANRLLE